MSAPIPSDRRRRRGRRRGRRSRAPAPGDAMATGCENGEGGKSHHRGSRHHGHHGGGMGGHAQGISSAAAPAGGGQATGLRILPGIDIALGGYPPYYGGYGPYYGGYFGGGYPVYGYGGWGGGGGGGGFRRGRRGSFGGHGLRLHDQAPGGASTANSANQDIPTADLGPEGEYSDYYSGSGSYTGENTTSALPAGSPMTSGTHLQREIQTLRANLNQPSVGSIYSAEERRRMGTRLALLEHMQRKGVNWTAEQERLHQENDPEWREMHRRMMNQYMTEAERRRLQEEQMRLSMPRPDAMNASATGGTATAPKHGKRK